MVLPSGLAGRCGVWDFEVLRFLGIKLQKATTVPVKFHSLHVENNNINFRGVRIPSMERSELDPLRNALSPQAPTRLQFKQ